MNTIEMVRMLSNAPIIIQQEEQMETNQQQSLSYLSSPAQLYSTVLQTTAPHVYTATKTSNMASSHPTGKIQQSKIIINTLKEEIGRSQEVLLNRITKLKEKCDGVHEQQLALRWTIETQIVPCMSILSKLLVDVCEQSPTAKCIELTDQHQTKIHRLRHPPTTYHSPLSPLLLSCGFSIVHLKKARQQPPSLASSQ